MNHIRYTFLTLLFFMSSAAAVCMADETPDTIKVIENARNIVVVSKDGNTVLDADFQGHNINQTLHYRYEVNVADRDSLQSPDFFPDNWGMDIPFVKSKYVANNRLRVNISFARRFYWGWRFNYFGKGNVKNGWETSMPDFVAVVWKRRGAEFELGFGFSTSKYYAIDGFCYQKLADRLVLAPAPDGVKVQHSELGIDSFQVPVLYDQHLGKVFTFSLGAIMNFNSFAAARTKLKMPDGSTLKTTYKGLQQKLFTVDAYAAIDICGIGFFAKWSPIKTFRPQFGPDTKGFTIGAQISLMNW